MNHYKSWSGLNRQLTDCLCASLKGRITYYLTRYHKVHNSYGRASILLDRKELVNFTWVEMYQQDHDLHELWEETGKWDLNAQELREKWDAGATYSEGDFLAAATEYLQLPIDAALDRDNCIIRIFAIMDARVGKRTLENIEKCAEYKKYPQWVRQFYELRLDRYPSL